MFAFPGVKKEQKAKGNKPSRQYRNPIYLAQEWQKALRNGDCASPAVPAYKLELSRARVTQILRLLNLSPGVLQTIADLGDPLPSLIISQRSLRPIVNLPADGERRRVNAILAGSGLQCYPLMKFPLIFSS